MTKKILLLSGSALLSACVLFGATIPAGTSGAPTAFGSISGTVDTSISNPFPTVSGGGTTMSASYTEWVVAPTGGNEYCAGCLDFIFRINNTGTSTTTNDIIEGVTTGSYASTFKLDIGYATTLNGAFLAGEDPASVSLSNTGTVRWDFSVPGDIAQGTNSQYLVVATNATAWTTGVVSVQNNNVSENNALVPASSVPEPMTMGLIGGGLAFFGLARLRKARKA
ncbi:MAG: PEP-CTERM sorting domain-containing protein [Acidobacteriaceae bacterium]|nr:PEP-CTERM sorting domain-containing protein [Acidobacteriaceae bacterium]